MAKIWGHRGCRGERVGEKGSNPPENSLASFQAAIDQVADGFELDVFLTKDKKLVVFHDGTSTYKEGTLERMTDGKGEVFDHTLAELKQLHLKDSKGNLTELEIPTLDEVLDLADKERKKNPAFTVNIEIKGLGIASHVADTIKQRFAQGWQPHNLQVSSFDMESLREMRKAEPKVPIGVLFCEDFRPWNITEELLKQKLATIKDVHPDTVGITLPSMTPETMKLILASGARPVVWPFEEVNPEILMQQEDGGLATALRIQKSGLFAIITDYPQEMRALLDRFPEKEIGKMAR